MKIVGLALVMLLLSNCASTSLTKNWNNPDYPSFSPKNILVIGVTPDLEARKAFEFQLIRALNARKVNALQSHVVFEKSFQDSKKTEAEIEAQIDQLVNAGYDAILISVVKAIEKNVSFSGKSSKLDYRLRKFIGYYLAYQEAYLNQQYYDKYNVFTIETSLYSLKKESYKSRVWSATYDLVDANNIQNSTKDYVKAVVKTLEKEGLIARKYME